MDIDGRSGFFVIWRDITERKVVEETLQKAHDLEQKVQEPTAEPAKANKNLHKEIAECKLVENQLFLFKKFFDASSQGLGWTDLEGRIKYINSALCHMLGEQRPEDTFGKNVAQYYDQETQRRLAEEGKCPILDLKQQVDKFE